MSAPLPIAQGRDEPSDAGSLIACGRSSASCAAHRSEVALYGLAVEMSRLHDDQRPNGVLGDERQVEQYIASLLGVSVRTAASGSARRNRSA
jgi:hypothetical protein